MCLHSTGLVRAALVLVLTLAVVVPSVRADDDDGDKRFYEPEISYKFASDYKTKPYIDGALGFLIIVACVLVAVKNPHRSHLD